MSNKFDVMLDKFNISQKQSVFVVLILIIIVLGVYWPVQNYEFVHFDDNVYVTDNNRIQSGINLKSLYWAFTSKYFDLWTPLVYLSFMLDYKLFGFNAGGYHWTNVILHIFNTILLFFLFRYLTGSIWRSAFVAALFAVHPINVESVAWISERKNVLSTFFGILTIIFYVWYVKNPDWKRYLTILISFALALMSKPMLITWPFVLLLLDYWPLNRTAIKTLNGVDSQNPLKARSKTIIFLFFEKLPLLVMSVITIFITIGLPKPGNMIAGSFSQRISNVIFSYGMYLKKLFWPVDLSIYYININVPIWQTLIVAVILVMVTIFVCKYLRQYPYLPVGWFWFLGTLVPVIGFMPMGDHTMADRHAYITFIGIFMIIVWGIDSISSKSIFIKKLLIPISALFFVFLTIATYNQIKLWTNTVTLFENAIKKNPQNYMAYHIVGQEMAVLGENEKALQYYDAALKYNSRFHPTYYNKALIFLKMGKRDDALKNFEKAIQLHKDYVPPYYALGLYYLENDNFDKSIEYFKKVIKLNPDYVEAYNSLGVALAKNGNIQQGILQFKKVLDINPNNKNAQKNMSYARQLIKTRNDI